MDIIANQLASALRAMADRHAEFNAEKYDCPEWDEADDEVQDIANRALAAYDSAQQPAQQPA